MSGVIIFDPNDPTVGFSLGDDVAAGVHMDIRDGNLYISTLANIIQWEGDEDNNMLFTWKSGKIRMAHPVNIAAATVDAEAYNSIVFKLWAEVDGVMINVAAVGVEDDEPFRLPGGYLASVYQIEIVSTDKILSVAAGQSLFDLAAED